MNQLTLIMQKRQNFESEFKRMMGMPPASLDDVAAKWKLITKADGTFELKGLPATTVTLRVWHEKAGGKGGFLQRSLKVNIPKDGTISQDLEFHLSDFGL